MQAPRLHLPGLHARAAAHDALGVPCTEAADARGTARKGPSTGFKPPSGDLAGVPRVAALALLAVAALTLAGCSDGGRRKVADVAGESVVEGWVWDSALKPVPGVTIVAVGLQANATTDGDGHYRLSAPLGQELVLVLEAEGFLAQSRGLGASPGAHTWLNVTLERVPFAAPYHQTVRHSVLIECAVTAVVAEDPNKPHEHQSAKCSDATASAQATWNYTMPANVTAMVLEAFWEESTPLATAIVLRAVQPDTGDVLAFLEGMDPLRAQLSQVNVARALGLGFDRLTIEVRPGAGTGAHDHGAFGAFVNQQVDLYMTEFYNGPADPAFTVADA